MGAQSYACRWTESTRALLEQQSELLPERDGCPACISGELGEGVVPVPVVGDERAACAQRRPRGAELEVHALVRVLADERIEPDAFFVAQPPGVVAGRGVDDPPVLLVAGLELLDEARLLDLRAVALEHGFPAEEALDELARDLLLELRHAATLPRR